MAYQTGGWYDGRQYWNGTFSQPGQIHPQSNQVGAGQQVSNAVIAQTNPANVAYINNLRGGGDGSFSSVSGAGPAINTSRYTVKPGDSLSKIATMYNVKWQDIYEGNKSEIKNPNLIYPGQQITIPQGPVTSSFMEESPTAQDNAKLKKSIGGFSFIKPAYAAEVNSSAPVSATAGVSSAEEYFRRIEPYARVVAEKYNLNLPALMAQSALETGFGRSAIGNNYFGIKGQGSAGSNNAGTWESVNNQRVNTRANFRAYNNPQESFDDYARLVTSGRYAGIEQYKDDSTKYAQWLKGKGYATDPNYVGKINQIINRYGLEEGR